MDALERLSLEAERSPNDASIWLEMAKAFSGRGAHQLAVHMAMRSASCCKADPTQANVAVWVDVGGVLLAAGAWDQATGAFRTALELSPDEVSPRVGMGKALNAARAFERAETVLRDALALRDDPATRYQLAVALDGAGKRAEAYRLVRSTLESDWAPSEGYLEFVCRLALAAGDQSTWLRTLARLTNARPTTENRIRFAAGLIKGGQKDKARRVLAQTLDPENALVRINLVRALIDADELVRAGALLAQMSRDRAEVRAELGRLAEAHGDLGRAVENYRASLLLDSANVEVTYRLGRVLTSLGNSDEGTKLLLDAAHRAPANQEIRAALTSALSQPPVANPSHLTGDLSVFSMPEYVEFVTFHRRTGFLSFSSPKGSVEIDFEKGQIVGVRYPRMDPKLAFPDQVETAMMLVLEWKEGSATFRRGTSAGQKGRSPIDPRQALFEAVRKYDERTQQ